MRNSTIDSTKGLLILLVMVGHLFSESVLENGWKWLIYGFHMPLFLGLSGYLFNLQKTREWDFFSFVGHYWHRMLLPWFLASLVYFGAAGFPDGLKGGVKILLAPWYHLWFVPVLFIFMSAAWFLRFKAVTLLAISLVVSLLGMALFGAFWFEGAFTLWGVPEIISHLKGDDRVYTFSVFFFLGLFFRQIATRLTSARMVNVLGVLGGGGFVVWAFFFNVHPLIPLVAVFLIWNATLIALLPALFQLCTVQVPFLSVLGINSLYYYLWHPAIFLVCKRLIYPHVSEETAFLATLAISLAVLRVGELLVSRYKISALIGLVTPSPENQPARG